MNYRSFCDLSIAISSLTTKLPLDWDLFVGIPRSGLLVANLLALHYNTYLADVEGLLRGKMFNCGKRKACITGRYPKRGLKVLVIDDSIRTGSEIAKTREALKSLEAKHCISYAAIYVCPGMEKLVDYYHESLPPPRVFEWNLMHNLYVLKYCMSIEGVILGVGDQIAHDCSSLRAMIRPSFTIGCLVLGPEYDEKLMEAWLISQGIDFNRIVRFEGSAESWRNDKKRAAFKADVCREMSAVLYIEHGLSESKLIAKQSLVPVFCTQENRILY